MAIGDYLKTLDLSAAIVIAKNDSIAFAQGPLVDQTMLAGGSLFGVRIIKSDHVPNCIIFPAEIAKAIFKAPDLRAPISIPEVDRDELTRIITGPKPVWIK
jgi:hypothetical protein